MPGGVTTWPSAASCAMGTSRDTHLQTDQPNPPGTSEDPIMVVIGM